MTWNWQLVATFLLIGAAVVYLSRHLLRSMTSEPGSGCGTSTGCGGCSIQHDRQCGPTAGPPAATPRHLG
jgi:hypothetical protein